MPAPETQGKPPKGAFGAAGAAVVALGLAVIFGHSGGSSSGGGENSGGGSAPTTTVSHESNATHAAVTPTKAKIIGGRIIYAVETHDGYSGTTLEACTPDSDGNPTLMTSESQARATSLDALGRLTSSDIANGVLCEIDFDNLYNNSGLDKKVSSGSNGENGVGAIYRVTLPADGASQGEVADVQRVELKDTVK